MSNLLSLLHYPHYKNDHEFFCFNSFQDWTEFGGNEANQEKAVPVKDNENNRTRKELLELASPS